MWRYIVESYEPPKTYPIVVHIFQGETKEEALSYYQAHLHSDKYISECSATSKYRMPDGSIIACPTKAHWEQG